MTKSSKRNDKPPFMVCIVRYTCPTCCRRWHSANGNLDDYQICKNCYEKCYPGSYKYQAPNKRGNQNPETYIPHNTELCGKCIRLGHSCMEELGLERPNRLVSNFEGEQITLDESQDFSSYFNRAVATKKKPEEKKPRLSKKMQRLQDRQAWLALMDSGKKKTVVKEEVAVVDGKSEQVTPELVEKEDNKESVAPKAIGKDEKDVDTDDGDDSEASTQSKGAVTDKIDVSDIGTDNIDDDNIGIDYNTSSENTEKSDKTFNDATKEDSTPDKENTEGTMTSVAAEKTTEEDDKSIDSNNETTEEITVENLSIADTN